MISKKLTYRILISLSLWMVSCQSFESPEWETEILTPIAKSQLDIYDMIADSLLETNNNEVSIIYREQLYKDSPLDSITAFTVKPFIQQYSLQTLVLESQNLSERVTIGELLASDPQVASQFTDGQSVPSFIIALSPPIDAEPVNIDITEFFVEAILTQGFLDISVENQTPVNISRMNIEIKNTMDGRIIYSRSVNTIIGSRATVQLENGFDLATAMNGNPIEGNITVTLTDVKLQPKDNNSVPINYDDYFEFNVTIRDMMVSSANAIFPPQQVVNNADTVGLQDIEDFDLTCARIKRGFVRTRAFSTLPSEIFFDYFIPNATLNRDTFQFSSSMPPAPLNGTSSINLTQDFDNYFFDLTGQNGDLTNTFYNITLANIEPTPEPVPLSLDDTLGIELTVEEMIPSYVQGRLPRDTFDVAQGSVEFDFFEEIEVDSLSVSGSQLRLRIINSLGIDGIILLKELTATNTETNESISLNPLPEPFIVSAATVPNGLNCGRNSVRPASHTFQLENTDNLINIRPNIISYNLTFITNPNQRTDLDMFAFDTSTVSADIEMELPLNVKAKNIILRDTVAFLENNLENRRSIIDGTLSFLIDNEFPANADIKVYFLNEMLQPIDSIIDFQLIRPGIPGPDGRVREATFTKIDHFIPEGRMQHILSANKVVLLFTFNSDPPGEFVRIYDDYTIDFSFVGDFTYRFEED